MHNVYYRIYTRYTYYTIYIIHIYTSKRTHEVSKIFSKFLCILLNLNPYYTLYPYPNPYLNPYLNHTLSLVILVVYFHHTPYILCIPSNLDIPLITTLLGAIHKRRPQDFAYFQPPLSAGVRIEPTPPPWHLASASIKKNLYCVVISLRYSGHLISHFLDK